MTRPKLTTHFIETRREYWLSEFDRLEHMLGPGHAQIIAEAADFLARRDAKIRELRKAIKTLTG